MSDPAETKKAAAALIPALIKEAREGGSYPLPETELKRAVTSQLKQAGTKRVPAKHITEAIKSLVASRQVCRDKRRSKGSKFCLVLPGEESRIYDVSATDLVAATHALRRKLKYPAPVKDVGTAIGLTRGGKDWLVESVDELAPDCQGISLHWMGSGKSRKRVILLAGEEDLVRKLSAREVLQLRLELAELKRGDPVNPHAGSTDVGRASASRRPTHDAAVTIGAFRTQFAEAYDRLRPEFKGHLVPLPRLRAALTSVPCEEFDRYLVELCNQDAYELAEHDHPSRLSENEKSMQLFWPRTGRSFYFVART